MARDEHRRKRLARLWMAADVGAAPWQLVQQELVVALGRQRDGLPALHRRRLPLQLRRVLAFLDHDTAPLAGPDVVTAPVLEAGQHFRGRREFQDPRVLRLHRRGRLEPALAHHATEIGRCLRLDGDARDPRGPRPVDERSDGIGRRRHRSPRHIRLAYRTQPAQLHAGHRATGEPYPLDCPSRMRLHIAPAPRLQQWSR